MGEKHKVLGRGISALISDSKLSILEPNNDGQRATNMTMLPIESLEPNPDQPRKHISSSELAELADSIAEYGVLQPILVTWIKNNQYQIIAGERRWRAAKIAGISKIPTIIKNIEKKRSLEISIIENIQRQALTPLEEANAYIRLMNEFSYTQEQLSIRLGKSRSYISNTVRLLKLPEDVKDMVTEGKLSAGHARALVKSEDPIMDADTILNQKLNVRQAEALLKRPVVPNNKETEKNTLVVDEDVENVDQDVMQLETKISQALGMKVKILPKTEAKATFVIEADNMEDFDLLIQLLCQKNIYR